MTKTKNVRNVTLLVMNVKINTITNVLNVKLQNTYNLPLKVRNIVLTNVEMDTIQIKKKENVNHVTLNVLPVVVERETVVRLVQKENSYTMEDVSKLAQMDISQKEQSVKNVQTDVALVLVTRKDNVLLVVEILSYTKENVSNHVLKDSSVTKRITNVITVMIPVRLVPETPKTNVPLVMSQDSGPTSKVKRDVLKNVNSDGTEMKKPENVTNVTKTTVKIVNLQNVASNVTKNTS